MGGGICVAILTESLIGNISSSELCGGICVAILTGILWKYPFSVVKC